MYEYSNGNLSQVSVGAINGNTALPARFLDLSSDGAKVFFTTREALTNDDTDSCAAVGCADVYVRDLSGPVSTTLVSTGPNEPNADYDAFFGGITPDGSKVYFSTDASLVDGDNDAGHQEDVYERSGTTTTLISVAPVSGSGGEAGFLAVSDNGNRVFFQTNERMVATDNDGFGIDIYERSGNQTALISTGPADANPAEQNACFTVPFCDFMTSSDGSRVFFQTPVKLTSGDTDSAVDLYERSGGATTLVSAGGNGPFAAVLQGISSNGDRVYFQTDEAISPADQDGGYQDIYGARYVQPVATPPSTGTPPAASTGTSSLTVKLSARKTQRVLRQGGVVVSFICNNDCRGSATGSINIPGASKVFRLGKASKSAKANKTTTLKLKLAKKARSAIERALKRGKNCAPRSS